jgi:NAD(P)H-hydrate epimerase
MTGPGQDKYDTLRISRSILISHQPLYTEKDDNGESLKIETFEPEALISLTVPKEGVKSFKGKHWLGGRFVPE